MSLTNYLSKYILSEGGVIYGKLNDSLSLRSWKNTIGTWKQIRFSFGSS